jgi:LacI family transcriptional regulator
MASDAPVAVARPSHGRVRAVDVAAAAGVSISTVSLVVNDKWEGRVAPDTAARVRSEVLRLGYVVDESARRLATGDAGAIAVVSPAFTNPFYAQVALGAAAVLGDRYQVVFSVPEVGDGPAATMRGLWGMRLAGALVAAPSPELLSLLPSELPVVLLDAPGADPAHLRVDLDVAGGSVQLGRHLLELGHRRIVYVDALPGSDTFRIRREALAAALTAGGAELVCEPRLVSAVDIGAAHAVASAVLHGPLLDGVTAVVGATDIHALAVLRVFAAAGWSVPGDVSVAGFDDQPLSAYVTPSLTTVALPATDLGVAAATALAEVLADRERPTAARRAGARRNPVTVLPVTLTVRDSTGPARC